MKNTLNIVYILWIVSLILPIIAYKAKPPRFITERELQIGQFQEPPLVEVKEKALSKDIALSDPFKIDEKQRISSTEKSKEFLPNVQLSLIYKGKEKYVMIGDKIFKEGDRFNGFTINKISQDKVLLKDKKGEEIWLKL